MKKSYLFVFIFMCFVWSACQVNTGTELVVESDTDNYTIQEVYMRKAGTLNYSLAWSAKDSGIKWTHANISCEPGTYHVYVKMRYHDLITTYATSFSSVTINDGESKFIYVRGIQLCQ